MNGWMECGGIYKLVDVFVAEARIDRVVLAKPVFRKSVDGTWVDGRL